MACKLRASYDKLSIKGDVRMKKQSLLLGAVLLAAAACLFCVFAAGNFKKEDERPVVRVGYYNYLPYIANNAEGGARGIDAALAEEAFGRMGCRVEFVRIDWDEKDKLLAQHEVDCLWAGFVMTGRESQYQWAGPYLQSRHVVVVPADSDIQSLSGLAGRSIAVTAHSRTEGFLLHTGSTTVPKTAELYSFQDLQETRAALCSGYYDAAAGNELAWKSLLKGREEEFRILNEPLSVTHLGVAFAKDADAAFVAQLEEQLTQMQRDGTIAAVLEKNQVSASEVEEVE